MLLAYEEISREDFKNSELNISIEKSSEIFINLFELGIINVINMITDKFNTEIKFKMEGFNYSRKEI